MSTVFFTTPFVKEFAKFFDDSRAEHIPSNSSTTDRAHSRIKRNDADPDNSKSWFCSACKLPIFSTPYKLHTSNIKDDDSKEQVKSSFLHEQCVNLPEKLEDCELHPEKPLFLRDNIRATNCSVCSNECGSKFYYCPDPCCNLQLDVACALAVKILHHSHEHSLVAIRGADKLSRLICGACGVKHRPQSPATPSFSYLCTTCGFWIHPDCASLPNYIMHNKHEHALLLDYGRRVTFGSESSMASSFFTIVISAMKPGHDPWRCDGCGEVIRSHGAYSCMKCPHHLHIKCALRNPSNYTCVSIRDLPILVHLPLPDQHTSMIRHIKESTGTSSHDQHQHQRDKLYSILRSLTNLDENLEEMLKSMREARRNSADPRAYLESVRRAFQSHPSTPSDDRDANYVEFLRQLWDFHPHKLALSCHGDHDRDARCIACVKHISPPLYSCSVCPDFFIHDSCYHLPFKLFTDDTILMLTTEFRNTRLCDHCGCPTTGFSYKNDDPHVAFEMDVVCALKPRSITHAAHSKTHILGIMASASGTRPSGGCDCCGKPMEKPSYVCMTCHNFALHTWCAMLPETVRLNKFDQHPLRLTTDHHNSRKEEVMTELLPCEICEEDVNHNEYWHYSCTQCEQSFHIGCIPDLDHLSNIRFGATFRDRSHDHPLTLVRGSTLRGYRCDRCEKKFDDEDELALECSSCCFWIHFNCADDDSAT